MRLNVKPHTPAQRNHNGAPSPAQSVNAKLARSVLANMLFEGEFYEDGTSNAKRIADLVKQADPQFVNDLSLAARSAWKLRHVPLFLQVEQLRNGRATAESIAAVIQRPDEMGEMISMYWKEKKVPLANQLKKGIAKAFVGFNEYQLAKHDSNSAAVSVRDVMFMVHPKPLDEKQEELFKRVANKAMVTPDTWETELSRGADKCETFTRLMNEKKLGALAFIRNLRNMRDANVSVDLISNYAETVNTDRVLPFRFIAAARQVPMFSDMLERMMLKATASMEKIPGKTRIYVDVSGSMFGTKVSSRSDLDRFDAAAALAVLCREICEEVEILTFSESTVVVRHQDLHGMALVEALEKSQRHSGTYLGRAITDGTRALGVADRTIVFTDEQSSDVVPNPGTHGYIINVSSYDKGTIAYGDWVRISGFSEVVLKYISLYEAI